MQQNGNPCTLPHTKERLLIGFRPCNKHAALRAWNIKICNSIPQWTGKGRGNSCPPHGQGLFCESRTLYLVVMGIIIGNSVSLETNSVGLLRPQLFQSHCTRQFG